MARHLLPTVAAGLVLAAGVSASPASADSIAYIKDGDVWLASPDGSRQQRVTTTGDLSYVSQADDGTMIALAPRERLRRLSRTGAVLAEFPTFVSDGAPQAGPVNQFGGPFEPEISPDGRLVAFEWFNRSFDNGNTSDCSATGSPPCYVLTSRQGVGITHADRFTPYEEYGLMTGWIGPQWVGNERLLRSDPGAAFNEDTVFTGVGPGKGDRELDRWFWDEHAGYGLVDAEVTRDLRAVAAIAGEADERLRVYRPLVDPLNAPDQDLGPFAKRQPLVEPCYELGDPVGGRFESLSFSPDGRQLAYGVGDGIWVVDVPDFSGGCQMATGTKRIIPGGRDPHWGPADIPPASAFDRAGGPAGGGVAVTTRRTAIGTALRRGITVTLRVPGAGRVAATASAGRRVVAAGRTRVRGAGRTRVVLRVRRSARARVRAGGAARLRVQVTFRPATGGPPLRAAATVRLARGSGRS